MFSMCAVEQSIGVVGYHRVPGRALNVLNCLHNIFEEG